MANPMAPNDELEKRRWNGAHSSTSISWSCGLWFKFVFVCSSVICGIFLRFFFPESEAFFFSETRRHCRPPLSAADNRKRPPRFPFFSSVFSLTAFNKQTIQISRINPVKSSSQIMDYTIWKRKNCECYGNSDETSALFQNEKKTNKKNKFVKTSETRNPRKMAH